MIGNVRVEVKSLEISQLKNSLHTRAELKALSDFHSKGLNIDEPDDAKSFLFALCGVESSFGSNNVPRYEPAYGPNGLYYRRSKQLQAEYAKYGALASCSYGPWQMMYVVALELGYDRHPLDLWNANVQLPFVVKYLNRAKGHGAKSLWDLAASYNGGLGAIKKRSEMVQKYVAKVERIYDNLKSQYKPEG